MPVPQQNSVIRVHEWLGDYEWHQYCMPLMYAGNHPYMESDEQLITFDDFYHTGSDCSFVLTQKPYKKNEFADINILPIYLCVMKRAIQPSYLQHIPTNHFPLVGQRRMLSLHQLASIAVLRQVNLNPFYGQQLYSHVNYNNKSTRKILASSFTLQENLFLTQDKQYYAKLYTALERAGIEADKGSTAGDGGSTSSSDPSPEEHVTIDVAGDSD